MVVQSAAEAITYPAVGAELDIEGVSHAFDIDGATLPVLDNVSLSIAPGEFVALLGPSGCGKTTLLNIISGIVTPSRGKILFDGKDVTQLSTRERNIAQVFQFPVIYDTMTVAENLAFPLRNRKVP